MSESLVCPLSAHFPLDIGYSLLDIGYSVTGREAEPQQGSRVPRGLAPVPSRHRSPLQRTWHFRRPLLHQSRPEEGVGWDGMRERENVQCPMSKHNS